MKEALFSTHCVHMWIVQEPNNLKGRNSFRYNGLVQRRTVGVEPAPDGKAVILVTKNAKCTSGHCCVVLLSA